MGEQVTVRVTTDNSTVDKGMEEVKVKLRQAISIRATETGIWKKTKSK